MSTTRIVAAAISATPIDADALIAAVQDSRAGATVTFSGVVRNHDGGRDVSAIDYVGHPSAAAVMTDLAAEFGSRDGVHAIGLVHRVGTLSVGEVALVVAVSASHRSEAFQAASDLVEKVKQKLPIWKRQHFADGGSEWSNCP